MDPRQAVSKRRFKERLAEYEAWVELNSKPRVYPKLKYPRGPRVRIEDIAANLAEMSKPTAHNKYIKPSKDPTSWVYKMKHLVKKQALTYTPSARIIEIALPKVPYQRPVIPPLVKPSALKYEATEDIERLAKPNWITKKYRPRRVRIVSKKALQYKASKRIIEIAKPIIKVDNHTRENPFAVSKKALHYKASARIIEIAKPKYAAETSRKKHHKDDDEDEDED